MGLLDRGHLVQFRPFHPCRPWILRLLSAPLVGAPDSVCATRPTHLAPPPSRATGPILGPANPTTSARSVRLSVIGTVAPAPWSEQNQGLPLPRSPQREKTA